MSNCFGSQLKKIRTERGLSQDELAVILKTSKQVISRYETGQRAPKVTTVADYAQLLGVPLDYLLGTAGEEKSAPTNEDGLGDIEKQLIQALKGLTPDQKLFLLAQIQLLGQSQGT